MKENSFKNLPTEELVKKEKQLKTITAFFMGILLVGFAAGIYLSVVKGKIASSLFVMMAMAVVVFINIGNLKALRKEIDSRN